MNENLPKIKTKPLKHELSGKGAQELKRDYLLHLQKELGQAIEEIEEGDYRRIELISREIQALLKRSRETLSSSELSSSARKEEIKRTYSYDWVNSFSEGIAEVKEDGKYGFIDKQGKEIVSPGYVNVSPFSEGRAAVEKDGKCGFIDKQGKEVIPLEYDWVGSFSEGRAGVKEGGKCGFIDKQGKEVIPPEYDEAGNFSEGIAKVVKGGESFYIDRNGNRL